MILAFVLFILAFYILLSFRRPTIALVTSPLVSGGFVFLAFCFEEIFMSDAAGNLLLGISIFPIVILLVSTIPYQHENKSFWPQKFARGILVAAFFLGSFAFLVGVLHVFGFGLWMVGMFIMIGCNSTNRKSVEMDVVSTIGACMRQNLPLTTALDMAAMSYSDKCARIFTKMSMWLKKGYSLSESLKRGYPNCPTYITSTVTVAESLGQLPEAMRSLEAEILEKSDDQKNTYTVGPEYPAVVMSAVFLVSLGLMIFIIPTFVEVLEDMCEGAVLPGVTRIMLDVSHWLMERKGLNALLVVSPVALFGLIRTVVLFHQRYLRLRTAKQPIVLNVYDLIKWHLPVFHWFEKNYSLMRLAGILRVALLSGRPVDAAIEEANRLNINYCYRRRIRKWLRCVQNGDDISVSALKCGVGHSIAWAFDAEINAGNTPQILQMLETFYRESFNFKLTIVRAIAAPTVILMLGGFVAFVVLSIFLPIIKILVILTESVVP